MNRSYVVGICVFSLAIGSAAVITADVKTQEKSQVKFEGALGKVIGFFGGKAAREGVTDTVAVKGDRKISMSDYGGQIIDLSEQKVYTLDPKNKTYTVKTFAQIRQEMEEAQRKAEEQQAREQAREEKTKEKARENEAPRSRRRNTRSTSRRRTRARRRASTGSTRTK